MNSISDEQLLKAFCDDHESRQVVSLCNTYVIGPIFSLLHVVSKHMFPHLHKQRDEKHSKSLLRLVF